MPTFFLLLFKINLVLIVFAAAYYLVLRKLTFYTINRAFLIFGILFSSVYPLIKLSSLPDRYNELASVVPRFNQGVADYLKPAGIDYWEAANLMFWSGVLIMAARLALQFISLYRIHKNSEPRPELGGKIRILNNELGPFSFWQTIYINPGLHDKIDFRNILEHERVHVEQWHTLDIILAELALVFYWFNPGIWLMKSAVRENIEFLTDARVLKKGIDKKTYQYSLLQAGQMVPAVALVNNFNLSDLKKRIIMMNARRSSPLALSRYVFLLPVLLISTLAFTITRKKEFTEMIFSEPVVLHADTQVQNPQKAPNILKKPAKAIKKRADFAEQKRDSTKRTIIIEAFDIDSGSLNQGLDALPEPYPGDRIKMITVKRVSASGGPEGAYTLKDSLSKRPKNIFLVHREGDNTPAPPPINVRDIVIRSQSPGFTGNIVSKFFLNGKEISREEFSKLDLKDSSGTGLGKRLMIRIEKN